MLTLIAMVLLAMLASVMPNASAQEREGRIGQQLEQPVRDTRGSVRPTRPGPIIAAPPITLPPLNAGGTNNAGNGSVELELKVTLEGARLASGLMRTTLADKNLVPVTHPDLGTVMDPNVLTRTGNDRLVDWVHVQIREVADPTVVAAEVGAVIEADGDIMSATAAGQRPAVTLDDGAYYVMVRHQSHLPAFSPVLVPTSGVLDFDFTSYGERPFPAGSNQKVVPPGSSGQYSMYGGNGGQADDSNLMNFDGVDRLTWLADNGVFGLYLATDYDLNSDVTGADKGLWLANNGVFGPHPLTGAGGSGAVVINEVDPDHTESDWVELHNPGILPLDISGYVLKNENGAQSTVPAGTVIDVGGYLTFSEDDLGFSLQQSGDAIEIYLANGVTLVDSHRWTSDDTMSGVTTWGRCDDGIGGQFIVTELLSPGAENICAVQAWPGSSTVTTESENFEELSGLAHAPAAGANAAILWGVTDQGYLHKIQQNTASNWVSIWDTRMKFTSGSDNLDSEGVTFADTDPNKLFVATERVKFVSPNSGSAIRNMVLRYDVAATPGATLQAEAQWDLTGAVPALNDKNKGFEAIAWIPDSYLVANRFYDQAAADIYDPGSYPNHGDGLFFIGAEQTGDIYVFALDQSSGASHLLSTIDSRLTSVMALEFDGSQLWVLCDNTCNGRTHVFEANVNRVDNNDPGWFEPVDAYAAPPSISYLNNEAFAIGGASSCTAFWGTDYDNAQDSIHVGPLPC